MLTFPEASRVPYQPRRNRRLDQAGGQQAWQNGLSFNPAGQAQIDFAQGPVEP